MQRPGLRAAPPGVLRDPGIRVGDNLPVGVRSRAATTARAPGGRAVARRCAAVALLSAVALLGGPATSALAGPGVTIKQAQSQPVTLSGGQISGQADTGARSYTVRENPGEPARKVVLGGLSIRGLLKAAGLNPSAVTHVDVVGADGPLITLTGPDINSPPFPEGPALVSDRGGTTTFIRPVRDPGGTSALVRSAPGTPLEIQVDSASLLSVEVIPSSRTVKTGEAVTLRARVRFAPAGVSFTYRWNFDDGALGSGNTVSHTFSEGGEFQPTVEVQGTGGGQCSSQCAGLGKVKITVIGQTRRPDQPAGDPLGDGPGGTGSGGSGSGSGSGDGSGGSGAAGGSDSGSQERTPPALRAERPEPHSRFSADPESGAGTTIVRGILLAGPGAAIEGALPGGTEAGSPKPKQGVPGTAENPSQLAAGLALALAIVILGALRERQRVRLRLA